MMETKQDEALAIVVHELRNELNVLTTWAGLLLRADLGPERRHQAAGAIHRGTEIARRLCDDLLAITTNGQPAFEPARVDLRAIANAGVVAISADARRKGVRIVPRTGSAPVWVMGDRVRLAEIVSSLLGSALAVTGPGDAITVEVGGGNGHARLVVADTGAGLSASQGLGLFVARRLVEQHDGNIDVHSDGRGLGARFVVTLRSATPDAA
jgi:signal transduction histidine kinase